MTDRALRFERRPDAGPDAVWRALTEPGELVGWLADATVDLRVGGEIALRFQNEDSEDVVRCEIVALRPGRLLEYMWHEDQPSRVRFELTPDGTGTLLTLTHVLETGSELAGFAAGWHHHLELLAQLVGTKVVWDWKRFHALRPDYERLAQQRRDAELARPSSP